MCGVAIHLARSIPDVSARLNEALRAEGPRSLRGSARGLAHEVRKLRNLWAHGQPFDLEAKIRSSLAVVGDYSTRFDAHEAPVARQVLDGWLSVNVTSSSAPASTATLPPPSSAPSPVKVSRDAQAAILEFDDRTSSAPTPGARQAIEEYLLREIGVRFEVPLPFQGDGWVAQGEAPVECSCGCLFEVFRQGRFLRLPDTRPWAVFCIGCARFLLLSALPEFKQAALLDWGEFRRPPGEIKTTG